MFLTSVPMERPVDKRYFGQPLQYGFEKVRS